MRLIRYEYPALNDFDKLFGALLPTSARSCNSFDSLLGGADWAGSPAVNLSEDANHYYAKVELPGVKKEDIHVEFNKDTLTVTAKRVDKTGEGESATEFARSLPVPDDVDTDKVAASYENGVLTLTLTKHEARNIEVR